MRLHSVPRLALTAALALSVALTPGSSLAAPVEMEQDRTDNGFSFSYDATGGEIVDAASSVRFDRRDPVSFIVYVRENEASDAVGERLRGRLSVTLNKERVVRYDGTFSLEITDSKGKVVLSEERELKVVLRPKPGERKEALSFTFDLPDGAYHATGLFEAS